MYVQNFVKEGNWNDESLWKGQGTHVHVFCECLLHYYITTVTSELSEFLCMCVGGGGMPPTPLKKNCMLNYLVMHSVTFEQTLFAYIGVVSIFCQGTWCCLTGIGRCITSSWVFYFTFLFAFGCQPLAWHLWEPLWTKCLSCWQGLPSWLCIIWTTELLSYTRKK